MLALGMLKLLEIPVNLLFDFKLTCLLNYIVLIVSVAEAHKTFAISILYITASIADVYV